MKGPDNAVADTLSRMETNALISGQPPTIDFRAMARAQAEDNQTRALQSSPSTALKVEALPLEDGEGTILCDTSTGSPRPLVPPSWRRIVFDSLHGRASEPRNALSPPVLYGPVSKLMYADGHVRVSHANVQRFSSTL